MDSNQRAVTKNTARKSTTRTSLLKRQQTNTGDSSLVEVAPRQLSSPEREPHSPSGQMYLSPPEREPKSKGIKLTTLKRSRAAINTGAGKRKRPRTAQCIMEPNTVRSRYRPGIISLDFSPSLSDCNFFTSKNKNISFDLMLIHTISGAINWSSAFRGRMNP